MIIGIEKQFNFLLDSVTLLKRFMMDIQSRKLELVRLILDTDNPQILSSVMKLFVKSKESDFWNQLSESEQLEIIQGIEEIEKGVTFDYEEIAKKYRSS